MTDLDIRVKRHNRQQKENDIIILVSMEQKTAHNKNADQGLHSRLIIYKQIHKKFIKRREL